LAADESTDHYLNVLFGSPSGATPSGDRARRGKLTDEANKTVASRNHKEQMRRREALSAYVQQSRLIHATSLATVTLYKPCMPIAALSLTVITALMNIFIHQENPVAPKKEKKKQTNKQT